MVQNQSPKRRPPARVKLPLWFVGLLSLFVIALVVASSIWLFQIVFGIASATSPTDVSVPAVGQTADSSQLDGELPQPIFTTGGGSQQDSDIAVPVISDNLTAWQGVERVNILLMGADQPCDAIDDPQRTDTLMIVSIDPIGKAVSVLSVPRDLWVEIPDGFGTDRINKAHYLGQIYSYPGGGPGLAVKTVEATIGVNIHYHIAIDYDAFVEFVDFIGGVDINVPESIVDNNYPDACYGYDPFSINAGMQRLDGPTALKYARTRATRGADFDRAQRQQLVGMAIREGMLDVSKLPSLITQAPRLWVNIQDDIETDLSLDEIVELALLARDIPTDNVRTAVIDFNYVYNETTPQGEQVLVPRRDAIRGLREELFAPSLPPAPEPQNLLADMVSENAEVAVWNGTSTFGLAGDSQTYLQSQDVNVSEIGNADRGDYRSTRIIDYGNNTGTTGHIAQLMGLPPLSVSYADVSSRPAGTTSDILIILGADWQLP